MTAPILLQAEGLRKHYQLPRSGLGLFRKPAVLKAVDDVSLHVREGETLGLVGESGSGKSTTGRLLLNLLPLTAGVVSYQGTAISGLSRRQFQPYRKSLQMVFQDVSGALNPVSTVAQLIEEPMLVHGAPATRADRQELVQSLLQQVGLNPAHASRHPHEFSGGQRQRIGIARALAVRPKLIVADEPVSALDVSVQSQILNLMQDMKQRHGLAYLFIAHNLAVVRHMSDRIAVMYLGKIVESADSAELVRQPLHPYTRMLVAAIPRADAGAAEAAQARRAMRQRGLGGDAPSPVDARGGCAFRLRCPARQAVCDQLAPALREVAPGHLVRCHLV